MLQSLFAQLSVSTTIFIAFEFALFGIFMVKFTTSNAHKAPAILTTCGILGTFIGISLGLLDFHPNDIQKSVPALIDGIKTAFWASACGIFFALIIKLREAVFGTSRGGDEENYDGATVDDLADLLKDVKSALVGSEESTLLGQIKLARSDSNDRLDNLRKSLDDFGTKIAENNSKALIAALEEVMRDFNAKINEQFGDNFKQLNQAVGKILEWQELYRQQMQEMIEQQSISSKNMATATERYQTLVSQAEEFKVITANMGHLLSGATDLIKVLETQRHQVDESLRSLAILINTASTGLPDIEKKIVELTQQLSTSVKLTNDQFNTQLLSTLRTSSQELDGSIKQTISKMSEGIQYANEQVKVTLLNTIQSSNQEINNNLQKINQETSSNVKQMVENTKEQVVALDRALGEELTKSLESLGRQLTALSQRFVEDYSPLTSRLREIVELSKRAS